MPKIKLNGKEIEAEEGKTVLEVALEEGAYVPHYCYHPGLRPDGNCRMCILKVSTSRKLEASCMYPVSEGMEVETEGPEVESGRKDVLEFMLANHPLDCPECDKAGECDLQDFTFKYRGGVSRFRENKVIRHTKDLGPNISIWGNRCIACTRCVRFEEDISGEGSLSLINRGDKAVIDIFPGKPIDHPMSMNVIDLCPVGALISRDFLYEARVWFTKETESVCASCSRGCNVEITVLDNEVKRMVPRHNADVNAHWMCDEGRLNTKYVASHERVRRFKGTPGDISWNAKKIVAENGAGSFGIVASTYATIEELWLIKKLADQLEAPVGFLTVERGEKMEYPGITIETDKTPNRRYAEKLFGTLGKIPSGCRGLLVINGIPGIAWPEELLEEAEKADFLAVSDIIKSPLVSKADVVLPGRAWAEKDGTFLNVDGRIQRIRAALEAPPAAFPETLWLQELLGVDKPGSSEEIFTEAYPGLDYAKLGNQGISTNGI